MELVCLYQDIPNFVPEADHYVYFDSPWTSLVKTSTMFVGELEFSDIPIDTESSLGKWWEDIYIGFISRNMHTIEFPLRIGSNKTRETDRRDFYVIHMF